jgi:hypothetical protein
MAAIRPIYIRGSVGIHSCYPTLPNCWQGEVDCVVGPFSSKSVAEYFARSTVDFGHYNAIMERVFASGDAWYVEVRALES